MSRRQARETALQVLFAVEVGKWDVDQALEYVTVEFVTSEKAKAFARRLVEGTLQHKDKLDNTIKELSKSWHFDRLANVDRNILRLALYEIIYQEEIPVAVSVNEAVDLAKAFGGKDSGRFVNGILGKILSEPEKYVPQQEEVHT